MFRETPKSLRWCFALLSALNFLIVAGEIARVEIARRTHQHVQLTPDVICEFAFRSFIAIALAVVAIKLTTFLQNAPQTIRWILHIHFWGAIALAALPLLHGEKPNPNPIGVVVSLLIYVYLLRATGRLAEEEAVA